MRVAAKVAAVFAFGIVAASCADGGGTPIDLDDKTGTVRGVAYIDQDADGALDFRFDLPATGASTALVLEGTNDTVARSTVTSVGSFIMRNVPVGRYQLVAGRGTLGDSVAVLQVETPQIILPVGDTIVRTIRFGFPIVNATTLPSQTVGRRVTVEGIALNSWAAFSDSTIHVWDGKNAILSVRVAPSAVAQGDSVRIVGTVGISGTKTILTDAVARVLSGSRGTPTVDLLSTASARTASAGKLAFAQARIANALIKDTTRVGLIRRVTVDDGSGPVDIILDPRIVFNTTFLVPGATLSATGLLTLASDGTTWQLKPRSQAELNAVIPTYTIAQARALQTGTRVTVLGKILNQWTTYADAIVHLADNTGAIRAIRVAQTTAQQGDSVRIIGTTGVSNGRPVITDVTVTILGASLAKVPIDSVSTALAATADGGRLADAQARVSGGIIKDTTRIQPEGDLQIGIDDGSGRLVVTLDRDIAFEAGPYVFGAKIRAAGLLTPLAAGGWTLKPRDASEFTLSFPTVTVAQVRTLDLGQRVSVEGIAITRWNAFGDSTVHFQDATGPIRAIRVTGIVLAGDSVRLLGTIAVSRGQRVLSNVTSTVLRVSAAAPEPDSISTRRAASADSARRDAGLARVSGTILGSQTLPNNDVVLTIDDNSGRLEVVLDAQISFGNAARAAGMTLKATGVLIPTGTGAWQLYPRAATEIEATFPSATIAEARVTAQGRTVSVSGIATTGLLTFDDTSVHLRDQTGSIRLFYANPTTQIFQGDSIRVIGSIALRDGQPVMIATSVAVLLSNIGTPLPDSVSTIAAAAVTNPARDAGQVLVHGRITNAQTTTSGEVQLSLDDGSGALPILLDRDAGFSGGNTYQIGDYARVTGVLIPYAGGNLWQLKPRSPAELRLLARPDTSVKFFRTTWREYLSNQAPAGWTPRWDRSTAFTVIDDATATDRKVLQWSANNPLRERAAFSYDGVNDTTDQEVYTEVRIKLLVNDTIDQRIGVAAVRIAGTAVDERGYAVYFGQSKDRTRELVLGTFTNGVFTKLSSFALPWTEDVWYSVRIEAIGEVVNAKAWRRGQAEPADFMVSGSAAATLTGSPGLVTQDTGTIQWDVFQVRIR